MPRPFTDIATINEDQPIKNGTVICSTTSHGSYNLYNRYVKNTPTIDEIYDKYGNHFYNGIFVILDSNQTLVGA